MFQFLFSNRRDQIANENIVKKDKLTPNKNVLTKKTTKNNAPEAILYSTVCLCNTAIYKW